MMETNKVKSMLTDTLAQILDSYGSANLDRFASLRQVDGKVRETKMTLQHVQGLPASFFNEMDIDEDFKANSRRVRLEALAGYINNALTFIQAGGVTSPKKVIHKAPDVSKLIHTFPQLKSSIESRWLEAQKCQHSRCFLSAVIMMGSILEALLLARCNLDMTNAYKSSKAPRGKDGKQPAIQDWSLNQLIDVAVDVGWIKTDRGKFSHALRESRNVVHPWVEVSSNANFDEATCKTSWEVLKASVDDLLESII